MEIINKTNWNIVKHSKLFTSIKEEDANFVMKCFNGRKKTFKKNEIILEYEKNVNEVGIVVSGSVNISRYDYWGKRHIVDVLFPSDSFGESYAVLPDSISDLEVEANMDSEIIFMTFDSMITMCSNLCTFHKQFLINLLATVAEKNIYLNEKLRHVTQPTLREKILSYLSSEAIKNHSSSFKIPLNRQEMADYLNADRSALSNELSKMKKSGIIDYNKNCFQIKDLNFD